MKTIFLLGLLLTTMLTASGQSESSLIVTCQPANNNLLIERVNVFGSISDLYVTMEIQYINGQKSQDSEALSISDVMDPETEGELIGFGSDYLDLDLNFESGVGSKRAALIIGRLGQEIPLECQWKGL
jgi:hypothetical protein